MFRDRGKGKAVPVRMSARVINSHGDAGSHQDLVLDAYLFGVDARSGAPLVRRTIRFFIE